MGIVELLALGVGLSMDAFAVSVCKGLSMKGTNVKGMAACGLWFGGFQALMPLIGYALGSLFAAAIHAVDHWIAFGLLAVIGANMIREALSDEEESADGDLSAKAMFPLAVATSIDALAVGVSLAMVGNVNIWLAITVIGCTTFTLSAVGVGVGAAVGSRFQQRAQIVGGVILILLGVKILLEHLGVL